MALRLWTMKTPALSIWLRFFTGVVVLLLLGGAAALEKGRYDAAIMRADEHNESLVRSLAQHASDSFEMVDLALVALSRLVGEEPKGRTELAALRVDMAEIARRVPRIRGLVFYEAGGWPLATSQVNAGLGVNEAASAFFRHHQDTNDNKLFIGKPFQNASGGAWLFTASRRLSRPDGSFAGVLTATIDSSYFSYFYSSFRSSHDTRVLLFSSDGMLLARFPYVEALIGKHFPLEPFMGANKATLVSGTSRTISPFDGSERLLSFRKVAGLPLVITYNVPFAEVIKEWREALLIRVPIVLALAGLLAVGGLRLAANAKLHQTSEASLSRLARTDALTGLLNRRSFDESIQASWRRRRTSGKPLSLLMIDVDCFKAFNDAHGHPAGDACLQVVATAVQQSVLFPNDLVVRYGGEEIAVILPDTSSQQAALVAERIRAAVLDLGVPHPKSSAGPLLTVSIGCSTASGPLLDATEVDLLIDADRALYKAKGRGRNQVVASFLQTSQPEDVQRRLPAKAAVPA